MFDLFDFTPVADDPFKRGADTPSPLVTEYQKGQPDPNADILAKAAAIPTSFAQPPVAQDWAQYAGDPSHPMVARIGSAAVEEARRYGAGIKNALQTFMGPMYGEGHVPVFGDLSPEGRQSSYAGAGLQLASMMGGPGGEAGMGAGWNPGASKYLESLMKGKPPLKPETAAAVQQMISKGPGWAKGFVDTTPPGTPGVGFSSLALLKHNLEEMKKPPPVTVAQPGTGLPVQAGTPAALGTAPGLVTLTPAQKAAIQAAKTPPPQTLAPKVPKAAKAVTSTPLSPQQALGFAQPATQSQLNQLFGQQIPALQVPTMKPYDPNVPFPASLAHETAPGTSGVQTPFNPGGLPMDDPAVMKRMQEQGFAPIGGNWLFWRGVKQHGPFSWDSAEMGYRDPSTKTNEPGLFLAPNVTQGKPGKPIANMYGPNVNPHVVRADNPTVVNWKDVAGGSMYGPTAMQKVIKDMWAKGHDAVLLKGISDIGGKQDQLVVRHANQVRHPHAAFDPSKKSSRNLLAARGTGGVVPLVVPDEGGENEQEQ